MQAAPPALELVGRIRGDVEDTVDTGLFQRVGVLLGVAAASASSTTKFAAAVANEYQLNLLLETGRAVDIIQEDGSAAEEAYVRKLVEILQGNQLGFHSAHG